MVMRRQPVDREFDDGGPNEDELFPGISVRDLNAPSAFGGEVAPGGDLDPGGGLGNTDRPRDVFPGSEPRRGETLIDRFMPTAQAQPADTGPQEMGGDAQGGDILSLLPQGVEAQGGGSVTAPLQSSAPQSVSMRGTPPAKVDSGPARQPFMSPVNVLGDTGGGPGLIGRGEGLFGGGIGMPGGPSGGPQPTEQMLQLLKQLMGQ